MFVRLVKAKVRHCHMQMRKKTFCDVITLYTQVMEVSRMEKNSVKTSEAL